MSTIFYRENDVEASSTRMVVRSLGYTVDQNDSIIETIATHYISKRVAEYLSIYADSASAVRTISVLNFIFRNLSKCDYDCTGCVIVLRSEHHLITYSIRIRFVITRFM